MGYIYPKKILTTTGHSKKHHTQKITNPENLCSGNEKLAYWGVKTPTWVGNYMKNYYDSVTTISGTYYKPEIIYATDWDIKDATNKATVGKVTIQYAWEQVSYSCGNDSCYGRFDQPTITLTAGEKSHSFKGTKPEAIRYDNSKEEKTKNTNEASLKNIHSFTVDFDHKVTVKQFKDMKLKFNPAKNDYHNHVRIIMQFIRIKVATKEPKKETSHTQNEIPEAVDPVFRIKSINFNAEKKYIDEDFTCTCVIEQTKKGTSNNTTGVSFVLQRTPEDSATDFITNIGSLNKQVSSFDSNNLNTITFSCKDQLKDNKIYEDAISSKKIEITAVLTKNADPSESYKTASIEIIRPSNPVTWGFNIHKKRPYIYYHYDGSSEEIGFDIYMSRKFGAKKNTDTSKPSIEYFTIDCEPPIEPISMYKQYQGNKDYTDNYIKEIVVDGITRYYITPNLKDNKLSEIAWSMVFPPGEYDITVTWHKGDTATSWPTRKIIVLASKMDKEFFKLRLEDGSDVRYNYLSVGQGDDLITPLDYYIDDGSGGGSSGGSGGGSGTGGDNSGGGSGEGSGTGGGSSGGGSSGGSGIDDDLNTNNKIKNLKITGEKVKIPVNDVRFVTFRVEVVDDNVDLNNVFCYLDMYDEEGNNRNDVIIGVDSQMELFTSSTKKYCSIHNLKSGDIKLLKFIVQSDIEQHCFFKLKPFNYDEKYESIPPEWTPCNIYFEDDPSIKLSIDSEINGKMGQIEMEKDEEVIIHYSVENKSNIDGGHNHINEEDQTVDYDYNDVLKYRVKESTNAFDIIPLYDEQDIKHDIFLNDISIEDGENPNAPWYNEESRILTFPYLPAEKYNIASEEFEKQIYTLKVKYKALQTGIYDFTLSTVDEAGNFLDDQSKNSVTKKILVGVKDNIKIKTYVSNNKPYIDEIIDYTIELKNYTKKQDLINLCINDIGDRDEDGHSTHYDIEYVNCPYGQFIVDENCRMGKWILADVQPNDAFKLVLTLRPRDVGYHTIQATKLSDGDTYDCDVKVLERNKQIDFNVYHAVSYEDEQNCENCDALIEICDDDFINLSDDIYYVFTVTNNNRNPIETPTHIYARLPDSFLDNDILCHSSGFVFEQDDNQIIITIPTIEGCDPSDPTRNVVKFCMRVQPSKIGKYISNFSLTNKNSHILHKQLTLNIDNDFDERKIEHQIDIYNFEKTNRYYRYEMDGDGNIYKFFNQGNRPLKYITSEHYKKDSLETFRGTNLKRLVQEIKEKSKYIEPELLRMGNNKLADKGYEIYPDSFMRRFGLLNSEVFHNTGQLPLIGNVADRAMRWNKDVWDTKVWGGGIYDNGVFDLSVNYEKIPKNFNILDTNKSTTNLQAIVDKVKPFGTQAICHYNVDVHFDMGLKMNVINDYIDYQIKFPMKIPDFGLISMYNGQDNSLRAFYELFNYQFDVDCYPTEMSLGYEKYTFDFDEEGAQISNPRPEDVNSLMAEFEVQADVFPYDYSKKYVNECLDIIKNYYALNGNTENIDFVKRIEYNPNSTTESPSLMNNEIFTFNLNHTDTISVEYTDKKYEIKFINDEVNNFIGFVIILDGETIFARNIQTQLNDYYVQIQRHKIEDEDSEDRGVIHFWVSSDGYEFHHLGYILLKTTHYSRIITNNFNSCEYKTEDDILTFFITNEIKTSKRKPIQATQFNYKNIKWNNVDKIKDTYGYAIIENNDDVDVKCKKSALSVPPLALKYKNFGISKYDELTDIALKLNINTNKDDLLDNLIVNVFKDAEYYLPNDHIARKIYYPKNIDNVDESFITNITIQQPNITICSDCMKTSLGLYDECQYCGSTMVSHYDEKKAVTICDNCGYIVDGWNDYCTHCLSTDVTKTKVDFNKTYCYDCKSLENDYYKACPKCFSKNILHMTNDEKVYEILNKHSQNIKPMTLKTDSSRVNICNITVPLNLENHILNNLEKLNLHISGKNYNSGVYYYCKNCGMISLDPDDNQKCPRCEAVISDKGWTKKEYNNFTFDVYSQNGNRLEKIDIKNNEDNNGFDIEIDLLKLTSSNANIKLLLFIENEDYELFYKELQKLDIDDEDKLLLAKEIPIIDISVDNIYYEAKFINQKQWFGLENLNNYNHTYIQYSNENEDTSQKIIFSDFDIPTNTYDHLYLCVQGYNKSDVHIGAELIATDKNENYYYGEIDGIEPNLFDRRIDLLEFIETKNFENFSIEIFFKKIKEYTDIMITSCYIIAEKNHANKKLHSDFLEKEQIIVEKDNEILIRCRGDDLWNILDEDPGYYDGNQLETGLICYIDFDKINAGEYIRVYDAELIISYKNKWGRIITESLPVCDDDFFETLKEYVGEDESEEYQVDETTNKYVITYNIEQNNSEMWGSIKTPTNVLNNLESEVVNNRDDKTLGFVPLLDKIAQSFVCESDNIGNIVLDYDNRNGYPGEEITVQIFDDGYTGPDNLLFSKEIFLPYSKTNIIIDVDIESSIGSRYWIVLLNNESDENNYHRFKYNKNVNVGTLMYKKGNTFTKDTEIVLSFDVNTNGDLAEYYESPRYWSIDRDLETNYKLYQTFYRYNTEETSNSYVNNLYIENGFSYGIKEEEIEEDDLTEEED